MLIRVAIIEDHPLMLKAIEKELAAQPGMKVVGTASHGSELARLVRETTPHVVILDLGMTGGTFEPITAVRTLLEEYPDVRVLVLTGYDDDIYIRQIIEAGAYGYVLKSDDLSLMLPRGVQKVYEGKRFFSEDVVDKLLDRQKEGEILLSEQELIVLRLAGEGLTNVGIARAMKISEKRVRNLLARVYSKFDMHDSETTNVRVLAINKARELGLLTSD
jgi:DNA-binding NarL/FixJ family response regulator